MTCTFCNEQCIKKGKQKNGKQKYYCKPCRRHQQEQYVYRAYLPETNSEIVSLIKCSCGIRDIARKLDISTTTVLKRIQSISKSIQKPPILFSREYEMDEMFTYIGNKEQRICIAYAIDRKTREVVGYSVGRRNKTTLKIVVNTLLLSSARKIRTHLKRLNRRTIAYSKSLLVLSAILKIYFWS